VPLSSGERLGHYKILSMIGKGGMGEAPRHRHPPRPVRRDQGFLARV